MCLVCEDYKKGKLTLKEALRNLEEMRPQMDEAHYKKTYDELYNELLDNQVEEWWELFGFGD